MFKFEKMKKILITGGAGFIGSHVVRYLLKKYSTYQIINIDKLTYAGNLENLKDVSENKNYQFEKIDIVDTEALRAVFKKYGVTDVIHLAAESHVDRSIEGPMEFVLTNVVGTVNLLQVAKDFWAGGENHVFHHVSTDEVFGSLGTEGLFNEETPYDPRSPYSASKASSDHFARAFFHTYNFPIKMSNCSNNYGSHHFPEKLIPLMIHNIMHNKPLPVYGKGENVRDWLFVIDHARAIDTVFHDGKIGETYNIGGFNEWKNIDLVHLLCKIMDEKLGRPTGTSTQLITYVTDRAGHDLRYAIDANKIMKELGWQPSLQFAEGLEKTVDWYLTNEKWLNEVTSGDYQKYYTNMYQGR